MSKTRTRREAILSIIDKHAVSTQHDLIRQLRKEGFRTTQSTLSRDIRILGLIKTGGRYTAGSAAKIAFHGLPQAPVIMTAPADALIVIKVPPGQAAAMGVFLDNAGWPEIIGTVAGDDTVFAACRDRQARKIILNRIERTQREGE